MEPRGKRYDVGEKPGGTSDIVTRHSPELAARNYSYTQPAAHHTPGKKNSKEDGGEVCLPRAFDAFYPGRDIPEALAVDPLQHDTFTVGRNAVDTRHCDASPP